MLAIKEFMGNYYIEGSRHPNRLYETYQDAEKVLKKIIKGREQYKKLSNASVSYKDIYYKILGSGSMDDTYKNGEAEEGFYNAYSNGWDDTSFSMTVEELFRKAINDQDDTILKLLNVIYRGTVDNNVRSSIRMYATFIFSGDEFVQRAVKGEGINKEGQIFTWEEE